jgi:hypothetical protein
MLLAEVSLCSSFASLEQNDAGPLNGGDAEVGRPGGVPVALLHFWWPYDIHNPPREARKRLPEASAT